IWLIPLFPLFGAALMFFFGRKLDPQPKSEVAIAPGVEPIYEDHGHGPHHHGHDHGHENVHGHSHTHDHDHAHDHGPGHDHSHDHSHDHAHGDHGHHHHSPLKFLIKLICPGTVLLSFLFAVGAVWQLSGLKERSHEIVQFT